MNAIYDIVKFVKQSFLYLVFVCFDFKTSDTVSIHLKIPNDKKNYTEDKYGKQRRTERGRSL